MDAGETPGQCGGERVEGGSVGVGKSVFRLGYMFVYGCAGRVDERLKKEFKRVRAKGDVFTKLEGGLSSLELCLVYTPSS